VMTYFQNDLFHAVFDDETGYLTQLIATSDNAKMNWVLENSTWGKVSGFAVEGVQVCEDKIIITAQGNEIDSIGLSLKIERALSQDGYQETYTITNQTATEFWVNQETFGIYFSFASIFLSSNPLAEQIAKNCMAHVFCGYNSCWICAKKLDGSGQHLFIRMTEGDICDYSIDRDLSRTNKGSDFRGDILLNPTPCVLAEGEEKSYVFRYTFTDEKLQDVLSAQTDFINVTADTYTQFLSRPIYFTAEYAGGIQQARVICNGEDVAFTTEGNKIKWTTVGTVAGEQRFDVYINGRHTYALVNFIENLDIILKKRASFIAEKQQFTKPGSHLDGAYLIYDDVEKTQFYSHSFLDRNAGRERIAMGVVVLRQLQKKQDAFLMESAKKHLAFVERELFDSEQGIAYNHLPKNNSWNRGFNYPWFSVYFKEWYSVTGDTKYLIRAAKCLIWYFVVTKCEYDGQLAEVYPIVQMLEKEGLSALADEIRQQIRRVAENYAHNAASSIADECTYVQECPNNRCVYASQAYLLFGERKYLEEATRQKNMAEAFYACQPDYHLNAISVRYWDRFWFGKKRQYGDLYPHYWSALMGWMYGWYEKASGEDWKQIREEVLKNNLCLYRTDGFASNNYLFPYKITMYRSDQTYQSPYLPTGTFYGKCLDEWSNDQDWALYLADYFMNENQT